MLTLAFSTTVTIIEVEWNYYCSNCSNNVVFLPADSSVSEVVKESQQIPLPRIIRRVAVLIIVGQLVQSLTLELLVTAPRSFLATLYRAFE